MRQLLCLTLLLLLNSTSFAQNSGIHGHAIVGFSCNAINMNGPSMSADTEIVRIKNRIGNYLEGQKDWAGIYGTDAVELFDFKVTAEIDKRITTYQEPLAVTFSITKKSTNQTIIRNFTIGYLLKGADHEVELINKIDGEGIGITCTPYAINSPDSTPFLQWKPK